ncbi:hypothetical protein WOLCODRAFT_141364 [Wolfiporia cocos MD-104 SS10]|uniref:F-box domain-containing protein n=1 Tax=Wolfiporia cocos (strain MD-104) TaxID=742152 RepID=A0A2H3JIH9_WOLCO|nr:hypothetical protein WOLCODRAFT_141364 [Wolfiporia cocos MD-104 SS10]
MKFSCDTAASHAPIELWELILDFLWDEPAALVACTTVCTDWHPRSKLLLKNLDSSNAHELSNPEDVRRLAKLLHAMPFKRQTSRRVRITGNPAASGSLAHIAAFAASLVEKFPSVYSLEIHNGSWRPGSIQLTSALLHLSAFRIVMLDLDGITLPSITVFGRLIASLSRLKGLRLGNLYFSDGRLPVPLYRRWKTLPKLTAIHVECASVAVLDALAATHLTENCNLLYLRDLTIPHFQPLEHGVRSSNLKSMLWNSKDSLKHLYIETCPQVEIDMTQEPTLSDDVDLSCSTALKDLRLTIGFHSSTVSSRHTEWVLHLMSNMSGPSSLERIVLRLRRLSGKFSIANIREIIRGYAQLDRVLCAPRLPLFRSLQFKIDLHPDGMKSAEGIWHEAAPRYFSSLVASSKLSVQWVLSGLGKVPL